MTRCSASGYRTAHLVYLIFSNGYLGFYISYLFSETDAQCRKLITLPHASRVLFVNDDDRVQCKRKHDSSSRLSDLPLLATAHVCLPSLAFTSRTSCHKLMLSVGSIACVRPHGAQSTAPLLQSQPSPPPRLLQLRSRTAHKDYMGLGQEGSVPTRAS